MSLKRQSVWNMLPLLVTAAVAFVSMPLCLRFLGNEMFAVWTYVSIFAGMFGFADMGLGITVGRYIGLALGRNDPGAVRAYWGTGNAIMLPFLVVVALVFIVAGVGFGPKWFHVSPENAALSRECFVAGGVVLFLNYYATYWLILSQAHLDFKFVSLLRAGSNLAQMIPVIFLAWLTHNPLVLILWSLLVSAAQLLFYIFHARRKYGLGIELAEASRARFREISGYLGKSFVALVMGAAFAGVDRVILGRLALPATFNPYVVANNLSNRLQSFSVAVMGPVFFNTSRVAENGRAPAAQIYNEMFKFVFDWFFLALLWITLWHAVFLRAWLEHTMGPELWRPLAAQVGPLLIPLVAVSLLTALANVSSAQLGPLNRMGTQAFFVALAGVLAIIGVWAGWHWTGITGAAYGFLISRVALVMQDFYVIRLLRGRGWLDGQVWWHAGGQALLAALFAGFLLVLPHDSYWLLIPAGLHATLVAAWLLRSPLRKLLAETPAFNKLAGVKRTSKDTRS